MPREINSCILLTKSFGPQMCAGAAINRTFVLNMWHQLKFFYREDNKDKTWIMICGETFYEWLPLVQVTNL